MFPLRVPIVVAMAAGLLCQGSVAAVRSERARGLETSRTFQLDAGHATRAFAFRERGGVILVNRLTVPHGVRAVVNAQIPGVAGARVQSWPSRMQPALACRRHGELDVCNQGEEWCPMPASIWRFRLVKLGGPAGPIRFDYVVAPPPTSP